VLDALVIGAGFGGLSAALRLAEAGASVALCETLKYPGGCASTFQRGGHRFEAGATLFAGFGDGQLFNQWIRKHALAVETRTLDPVVTLRAPGFTLEVPPRREELIERLCGLPGAPAGPLRAFFAHQLRVADALWSLFDDPALLPPLGPAALLAHAGRAPQYLPLLPLLGKPLAAVLQKHGVADFAPLRTYLNAVCQITVQASAAEAEAPFALAAMDYYFRGARHIEGGIGQLAWALCGAIEKLGGEVRLADKVLQLQRGDGCWIARTRRGEVRARKVLVNLLPQTVTQLLGQGSRELEARAARVEESWGAAMLYLAIPPGAPRHLELVADIDAPYIEGNHLFCSLSGHGTATISTHVRDPRNAGPRMPQIHAAMERTLRELAPKELGQQVRSLTLPASPRTFERFTGRPFGYVGGVPRRAGLRNYRDLLPAKVARDLWLVGDSVFPGQSTLAVALGGVKAAERALR
jgi:phytoene dehydrogenase-like protein